MGPKKPVSETLTQSEVDAMCEHLLVSGELTRASIESRLAKLRRPRDELRYLVVKLDYMPSLHAREHILNDVLFYLCYFRCFFVKGEPHFLPDHIQILVEVQTYHSDFLYNSVSFLQNLPATALEFKLGDLEVGDSVECPVQSACFFISQTVDQRDTRQFKQFPTKNLFSGCPANIGPDAVKPFALKRELIAKTLTEHYVDNPNRKGPVTFASLLLFCEMVGYEFKNLNNNNLLNMDKELLGVDIRSKKPQVFQLVLDVCVRAINSSIQASDTQKNTFERLEDVQRR